MGNNSFRSKNLNYSYSLLKDSPTPYIDNHEVLPYDCDIEEPDTIYVKPIPYRVVTSDESDFIANEVRQYIKENNTQKNINNHFILCVNSPDRTVNTFKMINNNYRLLSDKPNKYIDFDEEIKNIPKCENWRFFISKISRIIYGIPTDHIYFN